MINNNVNVTQSLKQYLRLTNEMRLNLSILQATHLELKEILNKEAEENPLIEDIENLENYQELKESKENSEEYISDEDGFEEQDFYENERNPDYEKLIEYHYNSITNEEEFDIQTYLLVQLDYLNLEEKLNNAVYNIIMNIDDNGFLTKPIEEISQETGIEKRLLEQGLSILQMFDPPGVGAKNVREALLLQMKRDNMKDTLLYRMVDEHFDLIEKQNYKKLAEIYKVFPQDLEVEIEELKKYSLYPGRDYKNTLTKQPEYIVPDIIVEEDDEGNYIINIPSDFPEIKINRKYINEIRKTKDKNMKNFLKKYEERIKIILEAIEKRNDTIKKVVGRLIEIQKDFIKDPSKGLKPLTLKELAQEFNLNESTISRIISKKYVQLPTGIYPLKSFFTSKLESKDGEVSSSFIKERIKELIDNEKKDEPLTDTQIANILSKEGIKISRRTVTKYREQLNIFPVNVRKNKDKN